MFSVTHYVVSFSSERWKYKLETAKARAQDCVTVYITFLYNDIIIVAYYIAKRKPTACG